MITYLAIKDLTFISNELDRRGLYREADLLDRVLFKTAAGVSSVFDSAKVIAGEALAFVGGVVKGVESLGSFIKDTGIPGLAFLGEMLKDIGTAVGQVSNLAKNFGSTLEYLLGVISGKASAASKTGGKWCVTVKDLGKYKDSAMLLLTILSSGVGAVVAKALGLAEKLRQHAEWIPGLSETIESGESKALALSMCFGGNSDIPAEAANVAKKASEQAEAHKSNMSNYANMIAKNTIPAQRAPTQRFHRWDAAQTA